VLLLFISFSFNAYSQRMSRAEYIDTYKDLAMREMLRSGIPASIKLAQGLLESDNGNSRLAVKGRNHFGIKCHIDWDGRKIYHDDDEKNECFRRYNSVYDSYVDHTEFLSGKQRYAFLFDLEITDYKGWARGLKKAGYATSRKYADLLIRIIEENELQKYDLIALEEYDPEEDVNLTTDDEGARKILINNRIDYIIVKPGDTFASLNEELDLLETELFRYNELTSDSVLNPGEILYLQPKRNRAEAGRKYHIVKEGETLYRISQVYGIKLEKLLQKNLLPPGAEAEPGMKLNLRKKKKGQMPEVETREGDGSEGEFQFEFNN